MSDKAIVISSESEILLITTLLVAILTSYSIEELQADQVVQDAFITKKRRTSPPVSKVRRNHTNRMDRFKPD